MGVQWHELMDSGDDFLASAPFRYVSSVEVSVRGVRRLAEDYLVEPTPTGSRFTWTVALEPDPALKPLLHLTSPVTRG